MSSNMDQQPLLSGNWEAVLNPRTLSLLTIGSNPVIVGSRSPPNDSLWDRIRKHGFNVIVYDRIALKFRQR